MERPPRDWKKHWHHYLLHIIEGALVGFGLFLGAPFPAVAICGLVILLVYQWLEFLRLGDTPSRDVMDIGLGFAGGVAAGAIAILLT